MKQLLTLSFVLLIFTSSYGQNKIINGSSIEGIEDIARSGLDELSVEGVTIIIKDNLSIVNNTPIGAVTIQTKPTKFIIVFNSKNSNEENMQLLSHELIHVDQYHTGTLKKGEGSMFKWKGGKYYAKRLSFWDRPWERDAQMKQRSLYRRIK